MTDLPIKFITQNNREQKTSSLIFREEEYSFDTEPFPDGYSSSVLVSFLELLSDSYEGKIVYVGGYCPLINYQNTERYPQKFQTKSLIPVLNNVSDNIYRIKRSMEWPLHINKKKSWVCIGDHMTDGEQSIEFVPNCVAILMNQEIIALWLRPETLPKSVTG